jgi:hypothetical protein
MTPASEGVDKFLGFSFTALVLFGFVKLKVRG